MEGFWGRVKKRGKFRIRLIARIHKQIYIPVISKTINACNKFRVLIVVILFVVNYLQFNNIPVYSEMRQLLQDTL